jgi:hypothetical protein
MPSGGLGARNKGHLGEQKNIFFVIPKIIPIFVPTNQIFLPRVFDFY